VRAWLANRTLAERQTIARGWGVAMTLGATPAELAAVLLTPESVDRALAELGEPARAALALVQSYGGAVAASIVEREYGGVRRPEHYPNQLAYLLGLSGAATATERLCLLGLLQQIDGPPRQYAIGADLESLLPAVAPRVTALDLDSVEAPLFQATDQLASIEQLALLLAEVANEGAAELVPHGGLTKGSMLRIARRRDATERLQGITREEQWLTLRFVRMSMTAAGLLRSDSDGHVRPTRALLEWMQQPQVRRIEQLIAGWVDSEWDILTNWAGLRILRPVRRDLSSEKRALLALFAQLPDGQWVTIDRFIERVHAVDPDFLRPDGDYAAWHILNRYQQPLDGVAHWHDIEGRALRGMVLGVLAWLGLVAVGLDSQQIPVAFRVSDRGAAIWRGGAVAAVAPEQLVVQPNFEIVVPAGCTLFARFQIGRIAERLRDPGAAIYRLTRRSLHAALERGIELDEIAAFLEEQSGHALPQNVMATLQEWGREYGRVTLRPTMLLEADSPATIAQIQRDKRLRLPPFEELGAQTWAIAEGDAADLVERLRRAGYGVAAERTPGEAPLSERDLALMLEAIEFYEQAARLVGLESPTLESVRKRLVRLVPAPLVQRAHQSSRTALYRLRERLE
jgi:Helicase conserved C-terminal domain